LLAAVFAAALLLVVLGNRSQAFSSGSGAVLYGVTGDGSPTPESLYIIGATTASESFVRPLGNGNDGEEIAYNPDSGLILHASGIGGNRILENIDPVTLAISPLTNTGAYPFEVAGLTYAGGGDFFATSIFPFEGLFLVSIPTLQHGLAGWTTLPLDWLTTKECFIQLLGTES